MFAYKKYLNDIRDKKEKKKISSSYTLNSVIMKRRKLEIELMNKNVCSSVIINPIINPPNKSKMFITQSKLFKAKLRQTPRHKSIVAKLTISQKKYVSPNYSTIDNLPLIKQNQSLYSFTHDKYIQDKIIESTKLKRVVTPKSKH